MAIIGERARKLPCACSISEFDDQSRLEGLRDVRRVLGVDAAEDARRLPQSGEGEEHAVDEAAALGSPLLVLVCGGIASPGLDRSREMVLQGIADLTPYAQARGVKLGIEPLHPMFTADRSVIATLQQANALADHFPSDTVGVVIDAYHVWWDPDVYREINRAGSRIFAFHVSDWLVPPPDFLNGRGLMGDGCIEFGKLIAAVNRAGYNGPIEVEIFNERLWSLPGDEALYLIKTRFAKFVQ